MSQDISRLFIGEDATIGEAVARINGDVARIALVTDSDGRLLGTIVDGDVRRGVLNGLRLESSVRELLGVKEKYPRAKPVTAPVGTPRSELLGLMEKRVVRQIPLTDDAGRIVELVTLDELLPDHAPPLQAVIMAGGYGTRLRPLTADTPKPMLPIGDRPIMERIVTHLKNAGIQRVSIMTHFLEEKIKDHFGDGSDFGVEIGYVSEDEPLGTAGSLAQMEEAKCPILVVNGDILTNVDFQRMHDYHRENEASLTVAVRQYDLQVPYGVLTCEDNRVKAVQEKPAYSFFVNAGIYLLEPSACRHVPKGERFDMTDLINALLKEGEPVVSFPIIEYWLDIGGHSAYEKAQRDGEKGVVGT